MNAPRKAAIPVMLHTTRQWRVMAAFASLWVAGVVQGLTFGSAALAAPSGEGASFPVTVNEGTSMSVSVSPDGRSLALDLQGSLWILPAKGGRAKRITDYFSDARQPVWSPDGKTIAYFAYRDGTYHLWTISPDGTDAKQLMSGPYDDREPAWSPDGKTIAFASDRVGTGPATYNIWTLEIATGALRQITSDAFENRMPAWSADGTKLAYSSRQGMGLAIWEIMLADGSQRAIAQGAEEFDAPSWSPTGELATIVADDTESYLQLGGRKVSGTENVFPFRPSWLPGTSDLFYVSDGKIRRRSGGKVTTIPFTAVLDVVRPDYERVKRDFDSVAPRRALGILKPSLSPDGKSIAFVALGDLYVVPTKGGQPENLTQDRAMDVDPAWSPDGTKIVYTSDKGGGLPQLWIRDVRTGQARRLTTLDASPLGAAWSPDGERIAFIDVDGRWGVGGVCVIDVSSGRITRLQGTLPQPGAPSWSADGRFVAVSLSQPFSKSAREGTNQIYVIPADGKGEPRWHVPEANASIDTRAGGGPAWSPDGNKMAAIYEGIVKIWPVAPDGTPLGPPRSYTSEMSHNPTWSRDSRTLLFQAGDALKTLNIETGAITAVPLNLTYKLDKPTSRIVVHVSGLVDSVRDETQHNKDIVIEGNRIVAIRDHDPVLHAGAKVIDGTGLTAIPGLIESHVHVQRDFGAAVHRAWLAYGVTTLRDPGSPHYDGIENREANEAGVRVGPRIYTAGPLLEWRRVFYKMGVAVAGPAHLRRELDLAWALKYDLVKSYVRMPDIQQREIVTAAHAMGVPVASHEIFPAAYTGVDATEHMAGTSRRGYSPKRAPHGLVYDDVIQLSAQTKRMLTPSLVGSLNGYLAQHPKNRFDPRLALYPKWARDTVTGGDPQWVIPGQDGSERAIKAIYDRGGRITAGTDTMIATNIHAEIAAYVHAGLTPFQALQTATVNPARELQLDAGTLESGKLADIVLVEGDPRVDISSTFNVRIVIANGKSHSVDDLINNRE
jgi:Tol biopolymer transport system component/imidazolonepropionase-like amidohydrolase